MSAEWLPEQTASRSSCGFSRSGSPMTRESAEDEGSEIAVLRGTGSGFTARERRSKDLKALAD